MAGLDDWARSLLEERRYAVLGTQDEDGFIHLTPVWFMFRDDRVFAGTNLASRKVRNIVARPMASLIVDVRKPGSERWVSISGPAVILRDAESRQINADILKRYLTEQALQDPRVGPAFAAADDATICINPAKSRSWSLSGLDAQFFGGILSATPDQWFRPIDS